MTEEIDLRELVIDVDDELIKEGKEPFQRPLIAYMKIAQRLQPGSSIIFNDNPLLNAVNQIYRELYRLTDLYMPHMPPMHIGAFMFRDVFFPLRIPLIFGPPPLTQSNF
ncbi:MAG: hypothetical protein ACXW0T_10315 [Methylobacter sp.]